MAKNLRRYVRALRLREGGKTLKEVGDIMGVSAERVRTMVKYITFQKNKHSTSKRYRSF